MGLQIVQGNEAKSRQVLAAVYARVSTLHGQDPTMQTRELIEYCQRRGWEFFGCYVDEGVSGKKDSRPNLIGLWQTPMRGDSMWWLCGALTASQGRCHTCAVP